MAYGSSNQQKEELARSERSGILAGVSFLEIMTHDVLKPRAETGATGDGKTKLKKKEKKRRKEGRMKEKDPT